MGGRVHTNVCVLGGASQTKMTWSLPALSFWVQDFKRSSVPGTCQILDYGTFTPSLPRLCEGGMMTLPTQQMRN